ncbi:ATP-binding SpoIIE family protein phosphatase [Streptomyces minutiscleroticus]|uniref:PPM-type phosphatase domain-containing protein n=1 Tax=Streptomyces minutiscleroticus TaxID=68238 RepID=A0A918NRL7_9ACTN|nr:ATP-binding SpoIIE family protein phosphatase [Streptomyces minutiscleroticus]GGX89661.1 hypothetical protein GCM10010358_49520 [Streptomyces minutiscleroticus]
MSATLVSEATDVVWLRSDAALAAAARREAAQLARRLGLSATRIAEVELTVTEVATNLLQHADDGALALRITRSRGRAAMECLSIDSGPGIADTSVALRDGQSSAGTLGIGLGAVGRLADVFDLHSLPGRGTVVLARFEVREDGEPAVAVARSGAVQVSGLTRPIGGEQVCGDTWAARTVGYSPDAVMVMMCDGLGHGPLAARVSDMARLAFRESRHDLPGPVLQDIHRALRGTRGAALAVALVDLRERRVQLSGVGNISAFVVEPERRSALLSLPGIVGAQIPQPRTFETPLPPGAALVMHSDGLNNRWMPTDFPGLLSRQPAVIAGQILSQAAVRRDDAGIVVVTGPRP